MKQTFVVQVNGLDAAASGTMRFARNTPGAAARALNSAIADSRARLVEAAKERYALTAAGERHLEKLRQTERASASRTVAKMSISTPISDMGYFESFPNIPLPGLRWREAPKEGFRGHILRSTPMYTLSGKDNRSKAFLARFNSGHVGMVQRVVGSNALAGSKSAYVKPTRWRTRDGRVEKLVTVGALSGAAQVNKVWPENEQAAADDFLKALDRVMEGSA